MRLCRKSCRVRPQRVNDAGKMAAKKKRVVRAPACAHVELDMLAYLAGLAVGPHAGDHTAILWCVDCGTLVHKRYTCGQALVDHVKAPRGR